jgi:hypothetical protein
MGWFNIGWFCWCWGCGGIVWGWNWLVMFLASPNGMVWWWWNSHWVLWRLDRVGFVLVVRMMLTDLSLVDDDFSSSIYRLELASDLGWNNRIGILCWVGLVEWVSFEMKDWIDFMGIWIWIVTLWVIVGCFMF